MGINCVPFKRPPNSYDVPMSALTCVCGTGSWQGHIGNTVVTGNTIYPSLNNDARFLDRVMNELLAKAVLKHK